MTRLAAHQLPAARLHDALRAVGLDEWPDADLLHRFAHYGEHESFEALLRRHGPMVFGVCRRVLVNGADAEDAFQAVFLVFVRKARTLRRGDRLGSWLYGVAVRVAMKARARRARSDRGRTEATDMIPDPTAPVEVPDWLPVLDAELQALPAKYREALVQCELRSASRSEAARALGIPEGTLSSRLARGRELLRRRLLKHGTLLPASGLTALFTASGVGRARVPVGLLAKTSQVVATTGQTLAGTVPAGAAQLMDEVLKGMMLSKLRMACGAILAVGVMAVGVLAAWPGEAPGQPEKPKASPQTTRVDAQPVKAVPTGPALPDRQALQGLWVLEKADLGKEGDEKRVAQEMVGKLSFLVSGDLWWEMMGDGSGGSVYPLTARIDSAKNPKWIDLNELSPGSGSGGRCIYDLVGDKLRICISEGPKAQRPAEFVAEERTGVMEFRREKMPRAAGDKALVGSWSTSASEEIGSGEYQAIRPFNQRVEILDGYLFVLSTAKGRGNEWIGGKYTVDTTKNPKWVDVELAAPVDGGKITKLYGCYEVAEGQLKLALGTNGKRVTRPLELKASDQVLFLDVKATKEPFVPVEKVVRQSAPTPTVRALPKSATTPPIVTAPASTPALPRPKVENLGETNPLPKLPASTPAVPDEAEPIAKLMKAGKFAEAENLLRERLAQSAGLRAAEYRLQLGSCLVERAALGGPDADSLRARAAGNFAQALKELDVAEKAGEGGKRAEWVRTQAQLRTLRVLQQQGKPDELLIAAESFLGKRRGTVEELIVWSFAYHAWKQKGDNLQALTAQNAMKELFDKFKDKPDAFPAKTGEYSRDYWEKVWFAEK